MGKISDQSSLGTRQATAEVELIYGGQNYRQSVSVLFTGFYPADNDATLAANSSSLVPTQAAVKSYVDSSIYGLKWKQSVRAATTAALTLASDFENGDIIDGYTLQTGDRILIKNQVSAIDNGIYVVAASGAPTRAADADSGTELVSASVMVERGTVNADTQWTCTANTIAIGVSNITWAQITSSGVADSDYGDIVVSSGVWSLDSAITFSGKTLTGGTLSGVAISGASSIATTVSIDANTSAFTLHDNSDTTKTATFGVSGITTGTNRVFTLPNASGTVALIGAITTSGFTQATGKMLGRSTASTGAIEEITVGTGLSLSGGTLSATGSGSVTATGGSLTSNAVVLGAGTTDTKVVTGITTDGTSVVTLGVAGSSVGGIDLKNATSGTLSLRPPTGALGTVTLTLPAATDTLVGKATTDTLTNKTLTSPTLTTPVLGTPASGTLTNCTGLPVAGGGTGVSSLTAYAPIFGGTTSTGAVQSGTVGTSGQVLTSNGAGALPTFQAAPGSRTPSVQTVSSASTVTPTFSDDIVDITAQAAALTLANPTGTAIPNLGQVIRIKDNGTARAISYGTQYRAIGVALPTTTVVSKTLYLGLIYNGNDTKWDVIAVGQEG